MARDFTLDLDLSATLTVHATDGRADREAERVAKAVVTAVKCALVRAGCIAEVNALDATTSRGTRGGVVFEHAEGDTSCLAR